MHPLPHNHEADLDTDPGTRPARPRGQRRLIAVFCLLVAFLLLTFVPPLINLSSLQLRIARNIGASIGRPVHFARVSPVLLPLPGFTLEDFVVDEDPAFGSEPILSAGEVRATLRISSIWRHRVEFSKISLSAGDAGIDPSVNLVRNPDGRWNIEGILLQASHIQAAPTAQRFAGPARRFPYIEATGARLNLKLGPEKTPFSLTDADFALWLPEPHQWHLRLVAHPLRTDTVPGDTGTIRVEGTLGETGLDAGSLAEIPIDLHGDWRDAQLGGLSRLLFATDYGLRGDFSLAFSILGTVGQNTIATNLNLAKARRAAFIPDRMLSLEATCNAIARNSFQSFTSIECHWPPADSSDPSLLILTADLPDVRQPRTATVNLTVPALPAGTFFDWLSIATPQAPAGTGTLAGVLAYGPDTPPTPAAKPHSPQPTPPSTLQSPTPTWSGELEFSGGAIEFDRLSHRSIPLTDVDLRSTPPPAAPSPRSHKPAPPAAVPAPDSFDLLPLSLPLGGKQPATLEGHVDSTGYTLHLTGTVICANLLELGNAVPQFGEGLEDVLDKIAAATPDPGPPLKSGRGADHILSSVPIHVDLTATRTWGSGQTWHETTPPPPSRPARK
jgi:AsmA protein